MKRANRRFGRLVGIALGAVVGLGLLTIIPEAAAAKRHDPQVHTKSKHVAKSRVIAKRKHRMRPAKISRTRHEPRVVIPMMVPIVRPIQRVRTIEVPAVFETNAAIAQLTGIDAPQSAERASMIGPAPGSLTPAPSNPRMAASDPIPGTAADQPAVASQPPPAAEALTDVRREANLYKADANAQRTLVGQLQTQVAQLQAQVAELTGAKPLFEKYVEVKKREYDFQSSMMTVNERNFFHQIVASYVILALVVFVVVSALYFAYVQLMAGIVRPLAAEGATVAGASAPPVPVPGAGGETKLDLSYEKLTVSSSVVGIIVLVISLAFLYIYTREIFHLELVDPYKPKLTTPSNAGASKTEEKKSYKSADD